MEFATSPHHRRTEVWVWLDDRLGIGGLRYPVPRYASTLAYTPGGITLTKPPARTLARQAHALLHIRGDAREAGVRLDAALESGDQRRIDTPRLRRAAQTLDGGDPVRAQRLIDEALSRPLGATSGKLLHGARRELEPADGAQETVGVVAGVALLLLGGLGLAASGGAQWPDLRRGEDEA